MRIESTNSLREDFWPTYDELNEVNQRIDNVENDLDLLNINVISNDTEIRESINSLKNSYNEQIITNTLNTNELNANYANVNSLNVNNIIADNVYIENLTVNRTVFDLALNTTHMENTTSLNGNFYSPNIIDPVISGNVIIDDADTITTNVFNANYATIDYLKINVSTPPIGSSAVLGYDSEGHIIPIHATYDVGFPTDADYIFTDIFGTAFAGVSEVQVGPSDNLIQAHAVQNMYNELNESFNSFNNNFNDFNNAGWFSLPVPFYFGLEFHFDAIIMMILMYVVQAVQTIGDVSSTTMGGFERECTDAELGGAIKGQGLCGMIGACIGGLPTDPYSQNVGLICTTKVVSRRVFTLVGVVMLLAGICPKFSALMATIPQSVLGGATLTVFAAITMSGIELLNEQKMSYRNKMIVGVALAIGVGIESKPEILQFLPQLAKNILGSALMVSFLVVFLLNILIPDDEEEVTNERTGWTGKPNKED